ncbi:hypothetical protein [Methylobacterium sp. 77]|uniref:hypothetical protein n=1 Tax=Methylobacterium sp. 77 TaxID=1101192 RepID=UPI0009DBA320|nr:hypothetical protein [Methylobacterium sp. 77]
MALALAGVLSAGAASAQYDDDGYDRPPPRRGYYDDRGPPPPRRAVGLNCDAVQSGFSGPQPYSCPLPGPRPLGARCFCDLPLAPFSPAQTAVGRVVP